jgi:hypothetical protein
MFPHPTRILFCIGLATVATSCLPVDDGEIQGDTDTDTDADADTDTDTDADTDTDTGTEFSQYDDFDENNITWLHGASAAFETSGHVADWDVTSTVTGTHFDYERLCVYHSKAGEWPEVLGIFSEDPEAPMEGNIWIIARVEGTWYAATFDYLRPGDECKFEDWSPTGEGPGPSTFSAEPLATWVPRTGEPVYMFMSTVARHEPLGPLHERSDYVQLTWP